MEEVAEARIQDGVMPRTRSKSRENFVIASEILGGCSVKVAIIRSAVSGLCRISSVAASMSDRLLLMSWRRAESLRFSSPICPTVKVTG